MDHKPLESIIDKKGLNEIETPRLQRLKEKLVRFGNFKTIWRQGKKHVLADTLSRAPVDQPQPEDIFEQDKLESCIASVRSAKLDQNSDLSLKNLSEAAK